MKLVSRSVSNDEYDFELSIFSLKLFHVCKEGDVILVGAAVHQGHMVWRICFGGKPCHAHEWGDADATSYQYNVVVMC